MGADNNGNGVPRGHVTFAWPTVVTTLGTMALFMGAVITFFSQIATMNAKEEQMQTQINALTSQLAVVSEKQNGVLQSLAADAVAKVEIETQLCAADAVRNLMHANDLRTTAIIWHKLFTIPLPTDNAYYPVICKGGAGLPQGIR